MAMRHVFRCARAEPSPDPGTPQNQCDRAAVSASAQATSTTGPMGSWRHNTRPWQRPPEAIVISKDGLLRRSHRDTSDRRRRDSALGWHHPLILVRHASGTRPVLSNREFSLPGYLPAQRPLDLAERGIAALNKVGRLRLQALEVMMRETKPAVKCDRIMAQTVTTVRRCDLARAPER